MSNSVTNSEREGEAEGASPGTMARAGRKKPRGVFTWPELHKLIVQRAVLIFLGVGFLLIAAAALLEGHEKVQHSIAVFLRALGTSFIPAALVVLLYKRYTDRVLLGRIRSIVRAGPSGVRAIYSERAHASIAQFLGQAKGHVDILVTNLTNTFITAHEVAALAGRGVRVRVLALSPLLKHNCVQIHPFVEMRPRWLGPNYTPKKFLNEIIISCGHWFDVKTAYDSKREQSDNSSSFELKVHFSYPTLMAFRCDDDIIIGFILAQGHSSKHVHVKFDMLPKSGAAAMQFLNHFDRLWNDEDTVPVDGGLVERWGECLDRCKQT